MIAIVFEYGSLFILSTNLHFPNFKEFIDNSFKIKTHTDNKYIQSLDEKEIGMQRKLWKAEGVYSPNLKFDNLNTLERPGSGMLGLAAANRSTLDQITHIQTI